MTYNVDLHYSHSSHLLYLPLSLCCCHGYPSAPSAPPQNIDGFALNDMSIQLTWDPPPLYQQNGVITSYFLNITERDTGLIFTRSTTDLQIILTELHPYYIYECHVAAVTVAQGPYTPIFAVRVLVSCKLSPFSPPHTHCR